MAVGVVARLDETIYDTFEGSVVRLHPPLPGTTGNGFIVYSSRGTLLIMSCGHIMAGVSLGSDIRAYFSDKSNETATLLHVDADKDLSLLKIARSQHAGNAVSFFTEPTVPEMDVVMLSFFKMDDSHVVCPGTFEGKIVGPQDTPRGPQEQEDAPKHECVRSNYIARPGTSGAPVFSNSRLLVGVHVWHAYEFSYAVSVPTIITALRGWLQPPNENDSIYSMLRSLASPPSSQAHTHEGPACS